MSALLRWIHKTWKIFWGTLLIVLLLVVVLAGGAVGLLQLDASKNYIGKRIESEFNKTYHGRLDIGELEGVLPFDIVMSNVKVTPDSSLVPSDSNKALLTINRLNVDLDLWDLVRKNVTITGFSIERPHLRLIRGDSAYTVQQVFRPRQPVEQERPTWLNEVEIVAPLLAITEGSVYINQLPESELSERLPQPFRLQDINVSMFLEMSELQRFLDIERFFVSLPDLNEMRLSLSGQVFNDDRFLEFNAFTVQANESFVGLSGEVEGVDLYKQGWSGQFRQARYDLEIDSTQLFADDLEMVTNRLPDVSRPWTLSLSVEGTLDSLTVLRLQPGFGESSVRMTGAINNLLNPAEMKYAAELAENQFYDDDLAELNELQLHLPYENWSTVKLRGRMSGDRDSVAAELRMRSSAGEIRLSGGSQMRSPYRFDAAVGTDSLEVERFVDGVPDKTLLTMDGTFRGVGFRFEDAVWQGSADLTNSQFGGVLYDRVHLELSSLEGFVEPQFTLVHADERIHGQGWVDLRSGRTALKIEGEASSLNIGRYFTSSDSVVSNSRITLDYEAEINGRTADDVYGHASIDIHPSVIGGDTVQAHQLYVDLDEPGQPERQLRLTSSIMDMELNGLIEPSVIGKLGVHWTGYLAQQMRRDFLLESDQDTPYQPAVDSTLAAPVNLSTQITIKDIQLLQHYLPSMPEVASGLKIDANINADRNRLLMNADLRDAQTSINDITIEQGDARLTGSFRYGRSLRQYSSVEASLTARSLQYGNRKLEGVRMNATLDRDSVMFSQQIDRISGEASFSSRLSAVLRDTTIRARLTEFRLGNEQYTWTSSTTPEFVYYPNGNLDVNNLRLRNREEQFELDGTFSTNPDRSVNYRIQDIQLGRISELVGGRINFSGLLNASFSTRSLTRQPAIQGNINVRRLAIDGRPVGDLTFNSSFNPQNEHFDTRISIITDTARYSQYVEGNDGVRQNIVIDGYFVPPDLDQPDEEVYAFDVDFQEIDMWILPYILPNIFREMEGRATGKGRITGTLRNYDFHSDFEVHDVYARPEFLNTDYWLDGHVVLDRQDGVIIDSVEVVDQKGGTGNLYGVVDLNNFEPVKHLDISLRLNRLQFLNNSFDQDVPFYGTVAGTGLVRLHGPNISPFLQTEEPIRVTQESRLSIPLLEETELNRDNKFIRFVEDFEDQSDGENTPESDPGEDADNRDEEVVSPSDQSFSELFDLDLQFEAPQATTVELIFDPVTGEVLTANGTGQMNITLDDQDLRMFGYYNIQGGSYQFVSGDIFTRRFELESGGRLTWEGDPDNARLDVTAFYRTRPNITPLLTQEASSSSETGQRVPVELVLRITGTVTSVENNFFFRLPGTIEVSQNAAITNRINRLNADEEQKLLQATSLLLTGNFIPSTQTGETNTLLRENLTSSAVVLNPLLSNQVLSPLLSSQINALLNSDVSSFDIDFNLTAYNQIDLGIALRLYNDRLILRREGQITGPQGSLGDLGATYRINQIFSLTAFHRQDLTLSTIEGPSGQSTEYLNGLGLEAQVQFNSWKELQRRFMRTISNIFSSNDEAVREEEPSLAAEEQERGTD